MDILLFLLIGQLLVFGTFASDKRLKEDRKTEQAITTDNENVTKSDAVFSPPQTDDRTQNEVSCGSLGTCPDLHDLVLSAERCNNCGFVTNRMSSDNPGANDDSPDKEMHTDLSRIEIEGVYQSQLDPDVAEIPISNLKASVYNELGRHLEDPNTHDGLDSWWKYIVLNDDISWKQLRAIENSESPGVELLNLLGDSGFTLADIEDLFIRHQMEGALSILRSRQRQIVVQVRKIDNRKPRTNTKREAFQNGGSEVTGSENDDDATKQHPDDPTDDITSTKMQEESQSYDDNDHCSSNPCKNEGTCIEEGDDYSCKCTHHWYSGKDCDKDDGPCETFCSERGTARCVYSGPGGTDTSCVCNAGYEGDKCDYFHDCAKNSLLTPLINICIERRMTNEECIRTATGIDKSVDSSDELVKRINNGDIQIPTIERNLRTFFGNLELFDLLFQKSGLGKLVSGSGGFIDNVDLDLGKEFDLGKLMSEMGKLMSENEGLGKLMSEIEGLGKLMSGIEGFKDYVNLGPGKEYGFHNLMSDIEGYKQQLQRQHQHSGDDGVVEVTEKYKKKFESL